jgi:uncharacterized protein
VVLLEMAIVLLVGGTAHYFPLSGTAKGLDLTLMRLWITIGLALFCGSLFKEWGIGKRNKDNGVLLLIAFEERKVRIEVGYGLEGVITDSIASSIIRNEITPSFANGQYAEGIDKGVAGIIKTIRGIYETKEAPQQKNFLDDHPILIIIFIFIIIYVRFAYFGGLGGSISFGKGGFGGFGGGRSGGGGTTGRW